MLVDLQSLIFLLVCIKFELFVIFTFSFKIKKNMHVSGKSEDLEAGSGRSTLDSTIEEAESGSNILADNIKSVIYGGLDGIITTFAVVAGVQGADLSVKVILALGFGNLLADAISMGAGDYLSDKAEHDLSTMECKKIEKNMSKTSSDPSDEQRIKLTSSYENNYSDLSNQQASNLVEILSKNKQLFIHSFLRECISMEPPDDDESPAVSGLVTMMSFIVFGFVPLVAFVIFQSAGLTSKSDQAVEFAICIVLTLLTMAALGAVKGKITDGSVIKSALFVAFNGAIAALASYLVSWAVAEIVGIRQ